MGARVTPMGLVGGRAIPLERLTQVVYFRGVLRRSRGDRRRCGGNAPAQSGSTNSGIGSDRAYSGQCFVNSPTQPSLSSSNRLWTRHTNKDALFLRRIEERPRPDHSNLRLYFTYFGGLMEPAMAGARIYRHDPACFTRHARKTICSGQWRPWRQSPACMR